jgi:hypothetical protein
MGQNYFILFIDLTVTSLRPLFGHLCDVGVPSFLEDFGIIPIEVVRGQIFGGWDHVVRGRIPVLGEVIMDPLG